MNWKKYMECTSKREREKMIEEDNKKIMQLIWIMFISFLTSLITTYLATGSLGL